MYRFVLHGVEVECETVAELKSLVQSARESDREFCPTDAAAGSPEKLDILRSRFEAGLPLWHDFDRPDYSGLTGAIRPRQNN